MNITLEQSLAPGAKAAPYDVRQVKIALNRLGFYTPDPEKGMTDEADAHFYDALYAFQRARYVPLTDRAGPGSVTERILNQDLERQNGAQGYIWRTVGDEKVRGSHASRNGKRFTWETPPPLNDPNGAGTAGRSEHPGEDYNCRCWAEHLAPPYHPWIEWVKDREKERQEKRKERTVSGKFPAPQKALNITPIMTDGKDPLDPFGELRGSLLGGGSGRSPKTPTGRKGETHKVKPGINKTTKIEGRYYSGHALDRMQERGFTPTIVKSAIKQGKPIKTPEADVTKYYDSANNISVFVNNKTGMVITVRGGK